MSSELQAKGLLLDMDGVVYVGDQLIEGAKQTLKQLQAQHVPFRFITNTTTKTQAQLMEKLAKLGLAVLPEQVFTAVTATESFLASRGRPSLHLLVRDSVKETFAEYPLDAETPDYVVIGDIGASWSYETLNTVFNMLMRGSKLVSMHRNKFFQTEEGLRMDIGAFVSALEYVSGAQATVVGKPSAAFFHQAVASLGLPAHEVAVVGDDIDSDVGGAQAAGLKGVLVKTGKYREEYARRSSVRPDYELPSIAELAERLGLEN